MRIGIRQYLGTVAAILCPLVCFSQITQLADSLNRRGMDFYEGGQYRQAEFYLHEAFQLYQEHGEPDVWLIPGVDYAEILVDRAKYEQALELFNRLNKVAIAQKNMRARARIENDLGWAYNTMGKNKIALNHLQRALPLAEKSQDTLRLGYIYNNIGSVYYRRGDYKSSLEYREKSLYFKKKTGNKSSIAISLSNIGLIYEKLLLYDKALEYYNQSLAIYKKLENVDLLADVYNNIAGLQKSLGEFDQTLMNYHTSLEFRKKAGNPSGTAATLNNIGTLYNQLGHEDQALEYYRQSMEVKKGVAGPGSMATSYNNIGKRLWDRGKFNEATEYFQKALTFSKQTGNPVRIASALLNLSQLEQAQDNTEAAFTYLQEATSLARSTQDKPLQLRIKMEKGNIFRAQDNFQEALDSYTAAYEIAKQMPGSDQIWPLHRLARTYDQLDSTEAISTGRKVIALIEEDRSKTGPLSQFKAGYFKQHVDFYIEMASWLIKYNQDYAGAYTLVESAKARALNEELALASQRVDEPLPKEERIERAQQLATITDLYVQLEKNITDEEEASIKKRIRTRELAYASFEHGLLQKYPQYKRLESPPPVSLERARQMCDERTAILEYAISDEKMLAFFITRDDVQVEQLLIDKNDTSRLAEQVSKFREGIIARLPKDSLRSLSEPIYDQLIAPFEEKLRSYENLIIIPDRFLAYLPFEALQNKTNYLISAYNIKYVPSITSFSLIPESKNDSFERLLVIGNANNYASLNGLPALPGVGLEIEGIASLFKQSTMLSDQDITEENVKNSMQQGYSVTHIAAHSVIDENNTSLSGIILGNEKKDGDIGNDGYLRTDEIYRLNISSRMIVLSACKSGMGKVMNGEGMLGLQRAFFNAGASKVVVSLWDVYDRPTTHFMKTFYGSLIYRNDNPAWSEHWQSFLRWSGWDSSVPFGNASVSMRETKLAMLEHPRYHHPVYWAPFIVVGR